MEQINHLNRCKQKQSLCDETPTDCHFELKTFAKGTTGHNDNSDINYLIYCQSGHVRISSTLFHDEMLCEGEIMFIPRQSECTGTALSDATLLIHKFNNTVCCPEKCILSYLYSHRHIDAKFYCCKLNAPGSLQALMNSVSSYIDDQTHDLHIWQLKHKELIWVFTRYFDPDELRSFFHPMTDEQVTFKSLVLTHHRRASNAGELAKLCGYVASTFSRKFKKEFGVSVYQWMITRKAEQIKFRLTNTDVPFADIVEEFNFSSLQHLNTFCKKYLQDTPGNIRQILPAKSENT